MILLCVVGCIAIPASGQNATPPKIEPLPAAPTAANPKMVALGKALFFDPRLSGDATISCATCHDPNQSFTDGLELSKGYPGTLYFRNTPSLINASLQKSFYWDGRMSGDDLPTLVRDHISEAHFMQADGRLVIERLRQIPEYVAQFDEAAGGEPSYGRILGSVTAFVSTLRSGEAPIDRHLNGDASALNDSARRGMALFEGKAGCISCHNGPLLSDQSFHNTGVPVNQKIFTDPERHITFRRFMRTIGVGECATLDHDIGCQCVSKDHKEDGRFRTPSLREVALTAPYMHNGIFASLEDVVEFYNAGGGTSERKDKRLKPLNLTDNEKSDLVAFLAAFSSKSPKIDPVEPPKYQLRELGNERRRINVAAKDEEP